MKVGSKAATECEQDMVKLTLEFVLNLSKVLEHAQSALEAFAKSAGSAGRRL